MKKENDEMLEITDVRDGRYSLFGKNELKFDSNKGVIQLMPRDALEIAYTVFDCFGLSYNILEDLEDRIIEEEEKNGF